MTVLEATFFFFSFFLLHLLHGDGEFAVSSFFLFGEVFMRLWDDMLSRFLHAV